MLFSMFVFFWQSAILSWIILATIVVSPVETCLHMYMGRPITHKSILGVTPNEGVAGLHPLIKRHVFGGM